MHDRATPTLRERLLSKIVMPGPATPCATWVGAYNTDGRRTGRVHRPRRPVISIGPRVGNTGVVGYVFPVLLHLAGVEPPTPAHTEACHRGCPCGAPVDGVYRCVDLAHGAWGTREENERDKVRYD